MLVLGELWVWIPLKAIMLASAGTMLAIFVVAFGLFIAFRKRIREKRAKRNSPPGLYHVALFHPYCNAGGGGERVLWCAVRALQSKCRDVMIIIYTGDTDTTGERILQKALDTFNIVVDARRVQFVFLKNRYWVEAGYYRNFTLMMQSIGSVMLALEALCTAQPDVFIDTMGYAFTLPVFKFLGDCNVGCYVHYPTISTDMLRRVKSRVRAHNNRGMVAKNPFLTWMKLEYYKMFARAYSVVGRCAKTIMVNSSWTEDHILQMWDRPFKTHRVYPPCNVDHLVALKRMPPCPTGRVVILSVAQFRPEKDHPLMLQAMYELRTLLADDEQLWNRLLLVIAGSCRNKADRQLLQNMKDLSHHLSLEKNVQFKVNLSHEELMKHYQHSSIGLHTMWNEHFGIGVVESMAAGLIMVANRSGGPMMDIVEMSEGSQTGFLAANAQEYAECIADILYNTPEENEKIRAAARASCERFSERQFEIDFMRAFKPLLHDDRQVLN